MQTSEADIDIRAPSRAEVGDPIALRVTGPDEFAIEDRFGFFDILQRDADGARLRLQKGGCGRAVVFLRCRAGNAAWIHAVLLSTLPETPRGMQERTCVDAAGEGTRYIPVELSAAYNDDIQRCFDHQWQWDAYDRAGGQIRYWTMPLFELNHELPRRVRMGEVPFFPGPMGPGESAEADDLLMMANTPPRELPTGVEFQLGGRHLHRIYLLSLNMILPQKCYVPAVAATVRYSDGSASATYLTPPLNFDCFYQDFGINTLALPLPAQPAYGMDAWVRYGAVDLGGHHLTMTDIPCDPRREAVSLQLRSIATETFMGLAGMTLLGEVGK